MNPGGPANKNPPPVNVAVLGGGAGALTTALALTDPKNRTKYNVTVYQMGWRLGGKGASGRNAELGQRIEEHGIHVWFGFYDNAFRLLSSCYDELAAQGGAGWPWSLSKCIGDRPPPHDNGAFYPHNDYFLHELLPDGKWDRWHLDTPENGRRPGDALPLKVEDSFGFRKLKQMLESVLELKKEDNLVRIKFESLDTLESTDPEEQRFAGWLRDRYQPGESNTDREADAAYYLDAALDGLVDPRLPDRVGDPNESVLDENGRFRLRIKFLAWCLRGARGVLKAALAQKPNWRLRRLHLTLDTAAAMVTGLFRDVIDKGLDSFDHLDEVDLRTWLASHGAADGGRDQHALEQNPTIRFVYNSAFSFVDGDHKRPQIAAGAALRGILRLFMTYKGAFSYRMSSGMGDVVFSPIYEVLRRRGVTFKFFHRVDSLELKPGEGTPEIAAVHMHQQVQLRDEARGYDPLVRVKNFPAWPNRPRCEQIQRGDELAREIAGGLNLEDPEARFGQETPVVLRARSPENPDGFDQVVLGIPVAALAAITKDLQRDARLGPSWNAMLENVKTTPTQAFQVWFRGSLEDLGWTEAPPISGTFQDPLDTYIDMTPALEQEERRSGDVKSLAYFCGVMKAEGARVADNHAQAAANARDHLLKHGSFYWPNLQGGAGFNWSLLSGAGTLAAQAAGLPGQYARANVLPSDRYTLGLPRTTNSRLAPGGSGVRNLFLAGDWTRNPINLGCVEATVMSGLQAARALTGEQLEIIGENDQYIWESLGRGPGPARVLESLTQGQPAEAASVAPGAPPTPMPGWSSEHLANLLEAASRHDREVVDDLCKRLVDFLARTDDLLPTQDIEAILECLRNGRFFDQLAQVADAMAGNNQRTPFVERMLAQGLIEQRQYTQAQAVLKGIDPDGQETTDEVVGLVGRVNKQLFVEATAGSEKAKRALTQAMAAYRSGYERDPSRNLWHGINLLALLDRAQRDKLPVTAEGLDRNALLAQIRKAIAGRSLGEVEPWDWATWAEAEVAAKDFEQALRWARHFVAESNAFGLGSFLRQLEQVWQLGQGPGPWQPLLTYLRAYLLQAEGGRVDLNMQAYQRAADDARGLQKILGNEGPVALHWYLKGLDRCRLVARIQKEGGGGGGTGFLVKAKDFLPNHPNPDEMLLLTNAHVLGREGIAFKEARVTFEQKSEIISQHTHYTVREILKSSSDLSDHRDLDFTLAALQSPITGVEHYPFSDTPPRPPEKGGRPGDRLYIVGHPQGRPLELSLYDNRVVDVNDRLLHYRAPTEPGSSGSPVFNREWELVGLHHAGGELNKLSGASSTYAVNEGIRIDRIREVTSAP